MSENQNHSERAHSKIGASSMYRWAKCPASVRQSELAFKELGPTPTSIYAEEGTAAHEMAELVLKRELDGRLPQGDLLKLHELDKKFDGMRDAVQVYVDYILELSKDNTKNLFLEHRFNLSTLHPQLFGTADAVYFDQNEGVLHVIDYKHGAGIAVEAADFVKKVNNEGVEVGVWEPNPQLMYYAVGAALTLNLSPQPLSVKLTIVQPRCERRIDDEEKNPAVRSFTIPFLELIEFATQLKKLAERTERDDAPFESGDWCRFCPAAVICPKLQEAKQLMASSEFEIVENGEGVKSLMSNDNLSKAMKAADEIESWIKAVKELAFRRLVECQEVKGFKLVEKRATRKWKDEKEAEYHLLNIGLTPSQVFDQSLRTPPAIEKFLKGASPNAKALFESLVKKESTGLTMVSDDDKRPAVNVKVLAKDEFTPLVDGASIFE